MEASDPIAVIILNDEAARESWAGALGDAGFQVESFTSRVEALDYAYHNRVAFVILDESGSTLGAWDFVAELRRLPGNSAVLVFVRIKNALPVHQKQAVLFGADDSFDATVEPEDYIPLIHARLERFGQITDYYRRHADVNRMHYNKKAYLDPVTGLLNELALLEKLEELSQALPGSHSLFVFAIDSFQRINNSFGEEKWEVVQKEIIRRLNELLGEQSTLFHIKNHEFAILASGIDATELANKLLGALSSPLSIGEFELQLTPSIGISIWTKFEEGAFTYLFHAKAAKDLVAEQGGNSYAVYSEEFKRKAQTRLVLHNDLARAIHTEELIALYQPQVDLGSGEVFAVEALLRWHSGKHGDVSPVHFIPLAEETGLIHDLGGWVIKAAGSVSHSWQNNHESPMRIAINVSPYQFFEDGLVQTVKNNIELYKLNPAHLELEITEGALIQDGKKALGILNKLKSMGLSIAVDDFGTGYASLTYLKKFPIDTIKIDRSFIRRICHSPRELALVRTIIELSRQLNLRSIAEGVETEDQVRLLRREGCDFIQGYYFSPPLAEPDLIELMSTGRKIPSHILR